MRSKKNDIPSGGSVLGIATILEQVCYQARLEVGGVECHRGVLSLISGAILLIISDGAALASAGLAAILNTNSLYCLRSLF